MPLMRACASVLLLCGVACSAAATRAPTWRYEIVATLPHAIEAFTQGLALSEGRLLESTGRYGHSAISLRELRSGVPLRSHALRHEYFGEGVDRFGDRIVQLTWQSGLALVYDSALRPLAQFRYEGEGWGLTNDGREWLMSDGSARIQRRDRATFALTGHFVVRDGGEEVSRLNELEYAGGRLYANVWMTDRIAVIDPDGGRVVGWLDLGALRKGFSKPPGWDESAHVLNGIAFDPASGHFFVTGKCWPVLYELRVLGPRT